MNELTLSTALETALNRIEDMLSDDDGQAFKEARKFLPAGRDALAALRSMPQGEPVAWMLPSENGYDDSAFRDHRTVVACTGNPWTGWIPLYTHPAPAQPLSGWIKTADQDRHHHDHPWNARTIILQGYYIEERGSQMITRIPGDTARLNFGEYHRIDHVPQGGVYTLFISGKKRGTWGFLVDGANVPWREYAKAVKQV